MNAAVQSRQSGSQLTNTFLLLPSSPSSPWRTWGPRLRILLHDPRTQDSRLSSMHSNKEEQTWDLAEFCRTTEPEVLRGLQLPWMFVLTALSHHCNTTLPSSHSVRNDSGDSALTRTGCQRQRHDSVLTLFIESYYHVLLCNVQS